MVWLQVHTHALIEGIHNGIPQSGFRAFVATLPRAPLSCGCTCVRLGMRLQYCEQGEKDPLLLQCGCDLR